MPNKVIWNKIIKEMLCIRNEDKLEGTTDIPLIWNNEKGRNNFANRKVLILLDYHKYTWFKLFHFIFLNRKHYFLSF